MWLLKLHLAISILCILTFVGFREVYKDAIKNNGWKNGGKKKSITGYWIFFIPLLNLGSIICLFIMIAVKKEQFDEWLEEQNKNSKYDKK